ncbi:MAG: hypothetical protein V1820_01120 [archaeon]
MLEELMGIFTQNENKQNRERAGFQPATIPFSSAGAQPPQWVPPRGAPLPQNYVPPVPQDAVRPQFQQQQPQLQPIVTSQPIVVQLHAAAPPQQQQQFQSQMVGQVIEATETQPTIVATDPNAPVFIKIDKYEEILTELSDMKGTIQNVKNLAEVFGLVREVQLDSIGILDGLMKELERSQVKLDKVLGRLEDVEERIKGSKYENVRKPTPNEMGDIEERIRRIREEIGKLGANRS